MHAGRQALAAGFSLYLDIVRFSAALFVVVQHLLMAGLVDERAAAFIPVLGREAVIVFFVMSGFLIMYSVDQKHATLGDYAVARCARIYSVALPVLLVSFALAALVLEYSSVGIVSGYQVAKAWLYLPFHLLFMGEFWNLAESPPWLMPYWSLGYEVWFYALFGAVYYLRGRARIIVAGAIFLLVGFKLWLLLPVWLSGAALYKWSRAGTIAPAWARAGWLLSLAALCAFKLADADILLRAYGSAAWPFTGLRLGSADRYLADYVVCVLVLVNFACARHLEFPLLRRLQAPVRALAAYTFTLYLVHNLVLMAWQGFFPHDPRSLAHILLVLAAVGLATYLAGFVTERRRHEFERLFRYLGGLLGRAWGAGTTGLRRYR